MGSSLFDSSPTRLFEKLRSMNKNGSSPSEDKKFKLLTVRRETSSTDIGSLTYVASPFGHVRERTLSGSCLERWKA